MFNYNGELAAGYLEADLITDVFEASMIDMMNIQDIQDEYMTESVSTTGEKIKDFFEEIVEKIKAFFAKIKKAIVDKITVMKINAAISKIAKAGIKDSTLIAAKGVRSDKEVIDYFNKIMNVYVKFYKKLVASKSVEEFERLKEKLNKEMKLIDETWDLQKPVEVELGMLKDNIKGNDVLDKACDRLDRMLDDINTICRERYNSLVLMEEQEALKNKKDERSKKIQNAKKLTVRAGKRLGSKISSTASRIGNVITKNKMASIAAISALAAAGGGAAIGHHVKATKESTFDSDSLMDSLMNEMLYDL